MIEVGGYPCYGTMTIIALSIGGDMSAWFAGGFTAVMTGCARAGCNAAMVKNSSIPVIGGMAVVTEVTALNMVGRFSRRSLIVVTAKTGSDHGKVIDTRHRAPGVCGVAIVTGIGALNMAARFSRCLAAIVAGRTAAGCDTAVVIDGGIPVVSGMAVVA